MSDIEITPEARLAVAAGFSFAGPIGSNEAAWRAKLNEGVLRAAAQMNGRLARVAQEMLDADVFRAEYLGYELEESSKRLLVRLRSETTAKKDDEGDGTEIMRTERTDGAFGRAIRKRLDAIDLGSHILVFKYIELMEGRGEKNKVRIMKHFEFLAPPESNQSPSSQRSEPPSPAQTPASSPSDSRRSEGGTTESPEGFDDLTNTQRVAFARLCRGWGVNNFMSPETDEERALVTKAINQVRKP